MVCLRALVISVLQAAELGQRTCILALIQQKADVGVKDEKGMTPADHATNEENRRLIIELPTQVEF
jgi:hypothetical protein